ncbi:Dipeptide transport system permease protein DppB [subsurface metagenome]
MRAYIIRRLMLMVPTLFLLSMLVFLAVRLIPGDIVMAMQATSISEGEVDREAIERLLGLDAPIYVQYGRWLGVVPWQGEYQGIFQGNLGVSWWRRETVTTLLAQSWPVTFELGFMSIIVSQLIAIPIGIYSAMRQDKPGDYIARSFAIICIAVPSFWLGTLVILLPSLWWGYMPPIMYTSFFADPVTNLKMFIVPAIVTGMALSGISMRMTRTMMLEVLRQDYIRTAWAKGLRERMVITRHALKNALIPVVTILGIQIPVVIGGTVITETLFQLPGMGRLLINAANNRDLPLISGITIVFASALILINLAVDLTYAFLDPRIRYK